MKVWVGHTPAERLVLAETHTECQCHGTQSKELPSKQKYAAKTWPTLAADAHPFHHLAHWGSSTPRTQH